MRISINMPRQILSKYIQTILNHFSKNIQLYINFSVSQTNFTLKDTNGISLHTAYSTTNFAYVLPRGTYNSGEVTIASSLPTIPANTLRIRASGVKSSETNMVQIDGDGSVYTGEIGAFTIGDNFKVGA